jgi:hypothetical protein
MVIFPLVFHSIIFMQNIKNYRIRRSDYLNAQQEALSIFSDNVAKRCIGDSYKSVAQYANVVAEASVNYRNALLEAGTKDRVKISIKNEMKKLLIEALDVLVFMMEKQEEMSLVYVLEAGFQVRAESNSGNRNAELSAPKIIRAQSTGVRGELRMSVEFEDKTIIRQVNYEFSEDQGLTWKEGKFYNGTSFIWSQLPSMNNLMIRSRATGTRERISPWSPVLVTDVF